MEQLSGKPCSSSRIQQQLPGKLQGKPQRAACHERAAGRAAAHCLHQSLATRCRASCMYYRLGAAHHCRRSLAQLLSFGVEVGCQLTAMSGERDAASAASCAHLITLMLLSMSRMASPASGFANRWTAADIPILLLDIVVSGGRVLCKASQDANVHMLL